jgi:hypothetical protein
MVIALARAAAATTPLQDKGVAALRQAHDEPNGSSFEHGGMIVENQGTLRFIEPFPENDQPDRVQSYDKRALLFGDRMVATYHTHPCMRDYYHQYFSTPDVIVAMFSAVPMFMLDECTGDVHEFFALVDGVHETGDDVEVCGPHCEKKIVHLPSGRIVGNIGVADPEHVNYTKKCKK